VRREIRYATAGLRGRPLLALLAWSVPEAAPATVSGFVVARAVDDGFLRGRTAVGLSWLAVLVVAAGLGAAGGRQVYRRLGGMVEPFRDDLVRRVVSGALRNAVGGDADGGALARLTRQVEIVRDSYAGLLVVVRGFAVTAVGVAVGLASLAPAVAVLLLPPFLLGGALFVATLGAAADRQRAAMYADERLAATAGAVFAGMRDVAATGTEEPAAALVARAIGEQRAAERALARVTALRTLCFAVGGWLPLVLLLLAGPWLVRRGLTAGAVIGGLTYVMVGLQPALHALLTGLGGSGLRFVVTLARILDAGAPPAAPADAKAAAPSGHALSVRGLTFAYGPHAEPVLRDLSLTVPERDHLTIVGPSGIGKSTLAGLLCGLLRPDAGTVRLGGVATGELTGARLAALRVLIPQEAYVFTGTLRENLAYLCPHVDDARVRAAAASLGADALLDRLGGLDAEVRPDDLSAGERQLLALVRAYLSPAPVAVLDEATCHLDPATERRVERAFAARGTLVVIAHRMSSALRARRVLVLDGSRAVAGDQDAVRAASPLYRELLGVAVPDGCRSPGTTVDPAYTVHDGRSEPAGLPGDVYGLDAGTRTGLGDDAGQVVAHGTG
jgi:ATP-binding cassette subfamily C protein